MRVAGLFAGIGGIEEGLSNAIGPDQLETLMLCESWEPAQAVLAKHFPGPELRSDVRSLGRLPTGTNLVTAGFPCTDLSQAGRTAGIEGASSGLVLHVFEALWREKRARRRMPTILIENVLNMLALAGGNAMRVIVEEIERLGYRWAYRTVDSRFTGVPQRRRRVIFLASTQLDPAQVLFADEVGPRPESELRDDAFGFYWTEGRRGLGWAQDAVPTLKGGSSLGIPSPPALWVPGNPIGRQFVTPLIEDAEAMQGFERGWTIPGAAGPRGHGARWKMVGNAVTVGVAEWVGRRLTAPGPVVCENRDVLGSTWPTAARGDRRGRVAVQASEWPELSPIQHLTDVIDVSVAPSVSPRAITGFWNRLESGNLGRHPGFRDAIANHLDWIAGSGSCVA
jgi:DNA (cytosine-5)-methyltransferase 1